MAKKNFSADMNNYFLKSNEEVKPVDSAEQITMRGSAETATALVAPLLRKSHNKTFASDLDSLFKDAFTEVVEEKIDSLKRKSGFDAPSIFQESESSPSRLSGLDALIRSTVNASLAELHHQSIKRLTIIVENQKAEKLKSIAKLEKSFVKDLLSSVVNEYIDKYEAQFGKSL